MGVVSSVCGGVCRVCMCVYFMRKQLQHCWVSEVGEAS